MEMMGLLTKYSVDWETYIGYELQWAVDVENGEAIVDHLDNM